jgi:hypothetical protein
MAPFLAARRQHPAAALGFHAYAEAVRLGAPAFARLKCALWQSNPPLIYAIAGQSLSPATAEHPTSLFTGWFRI